jgi:serine/threonine protein kinase
MSGTPGGIIRLLDHQELVTIADLRQGLDLPRPFVNRRFSCVANTPLGRPIRQFTSIPELLEVLRDLVRALQSLYVNARILHRDIAIKNLIITPQHSADSSKGTLLDFNYALDLANARPIEPMVGSDGFMAIGILSGRRHTYRHDLESLFYVFLWIAIANDRVHDEATDIVKGLPETSRLWKWCTMDFGAVGRDKAADMSPEGFEGILAEFSPDFAPLQGLARELHTLIFPVRDGKIFTGTETDPEAVQRLYDGMADAFSRSASAFQG